jgi:hypothetical protein
MDTPPLSESLFKSMNPSECMSFPESRDSLDMFSKSTVSQTHAIFTLNPCSPSDVQNEEHHDFRSNEFVLGKMMMRLSQFFIKQMTEILLTLIVMTKIRMRVTNLTK